MERQADWRQEKAQALARARVVVIKVGSAVLTDAQGLSTPVLESLARQMAALRTAPDGHERRLVLVSSGAVAAGRAVLRAHGHSGETSGLSARQAAAAVGQGQLMRAWDEVFRAYDFPTSQVLLTRDDLRARQRFLNARNTFAELMDWGVLPIVNENDTELGGVKEVSAEVEGAGAWSRLKFVNENDTVSVSELKFGDNDCLASLLVNLIGADLYINLTSAPGVYAANPQEVPDAGILECVEDVAGLDLGRLCGGKTSVGTGGMYSKLQAARRAAQLGVPTLILPGREADVLARAFAGEAVGTWVRPEEHAIPRRKFWLAYQSDPAGTVLVDAGAAEALLSKGSSLLPGGVRQVLGNFQKGALVRVARLGESDGHASLGVGLSNYSAADLRKIMGLRRHEVAAILGDAHYPEVIHRDNLLMDAAI